MSATPLAASEITDLVAGLKRLARNLWWTWNQAPQEIFNELSPRCWQNLYHNAVAVLREVSDYELRVRLQDPDFAGRVRTSSSDFEAYMHDTENLGPPKRPRPAQKSRRLFLRRIRLPRNPAHRRRRPGHPRRRPRQIRQRPGHGLCRHQPVLPRRLFPADHQLRTTGRPNITPCSTRTTCRWNRCSTATASRWSASWKLT